MITRNTYTFIHVYLCIYIYIYQHIIYIYVYIDMYYVYSIVLLRQLGCRARPTKQASPRATRQERYLALALAACAWALY